ncbi:hypothetical protein [Bradyrhizobium elkanii]|uniref:Uncharacterized protein n=1 Tax=Bradyrhizobium elkanii TaxID=29448 RepID=A0ABV4F0Y2_BRAEL|nr:hypothetical protein [Bradyrhizobium elkanii]MCP1757715.1 hypothetical protein [Bradyrhizobium elkanii]MCS3881988.1 hypothetical protein [Bradyrhizobium elkanii]MCS4218748.1 hypothetical protein [Bradyrhizobium elkanii]MCW2109945.1 hypothetical protein [Bradyrhizobium elkanii]MCW2201682.1 hypothetical protein [Bradyrhizobium elkanii]
MNDIAPSWKVGKRDGIKRYRSTCKHHGETIRWTTNGTCIHCNKVQADAYRKRNPKKLLVSRRKWDADNPEKAMLQRARGRARSMGLPFDLTIDDIVIPETCPVLGIPLIRSGHPDSRPSLDRVKNELGYVKGNVNVISYLANRIKNNSTLDQLKKVVAYYEENIS